MVRFFTLCIFHQLIEIICQRNKQGRGLLSHSELLKAHHRHVFFVDVPFFIRKLLKQHIPGIIVIIVVNHQALFVKFSKFGYVRVGIVFYGGWPQEDQTYVGYGKEK